MPNYAVTRFQTAIASLATVLAALETQIETVDNTKTIREFGVYQIAADTFVGALVYDT